MNPEFALITPCGRGRAEQPNVNIGRGRRAVPRSQERTWSIKEATSAISQASAILPPSRWQMTA